MRLPSICRQIFGMGNSSRLQLDWLSYSFAHFANPVNNNYTKILQRLYNRNIIKKIFAIIAETRTENHTFFSHKVIYLTKRQIPHYGHYVQSAPYLGA